MLKTALIAAVTLLGAGTAYAEEVIIERPAPADTSKTTVEKHGPDCDSKTVHREDSSGASSTVTREDCD